MVQGEGDEQAMRCEQNEQAWPSSYPMKLRGAAPRCERRFPGASDAWRSGPVTGVSMVGCLKN